MPTHLSTLQPSQLHRTFIHYLLHEMEIGMPDALFLLSPEDQAWLIEKIISDTEDALLFAAQLTDMPLRQRYWQQYNDLLGYLFHWHEHWSKYHSQLVSVLHTAVSRYPVEAFTTERAKIMRRLTERLHEACLSRQDIFSAEDALREVGWDTELDLSPIANDLFLSYAQELGRA